MNQDKKEQTVHYRMRGYRPEKDAFEYWTCDGAPDKNNPSGEPIQDVVVVSRWVS